MVYKVLMIMVAMLVEKVELASSQLKGIFQFVSTNGKNGDRKVRSS